MNATNDSRKTELHWDAAFNNVEAVQTLLPHGADRNAQNKNETSLCQADREGLIQACELLLDHYYTNCMLHDHMNCLMRDVAALRLNKDVQLLDEHEQSRLSSVL